MILSYKTNALLLVFIFFASLVNAQQVNLQSIDKKDLRNYVRTLSSPEFEGRQSGTEGGEKTAQYIADTFKELQLLPLQNNTYFQSFTLTRYYISPSFIKTKSEELVSFVDYVAPRNTNIPVETEKTVVFGGNGTPEELDKVDIEGNIVLVFHSSLRNTQKLDKELQKRNAFGFMVAMPDDNSKFDYHKRTSSHLLRAKISSESKSRAMRLPNYIPKVTLLPEFALSNQAVSTILNTSISRLKTFVKNGNIEDVPPQSVQIQHRKTQANFTEKNVVARIEGKSPHAIVISAHYDHLGQRENGYFPGADDNASGVAALLELAQTFSERKDLRYSMIFLAAAAEEHGLLGSEYFVENPIPGVTDSILLNINIDMISRDDWRTAKEKNNSFYFIAKDIDTAFVNLFQKADHLFDNCDLLYQPKDIETYFYQSDQMNFYAKDIPAVFLFSGTHDDYHRATDTYDKIDYSKLTERVQLIATAIDLIQMEYPDSD